MYTRIWCGNLKERDHLNDPGVDWKDNIKPDFKDIGCHGLVWINVAQVRNKLRDVVNTVMNVGGP